MWVTPALTKTLTFVKLPCALACGPPLGHHHPLRTTERSTHGHPTPPHCHIPSPLLSPFQPQTQPEGYLRPGWSWSIQNTKDGKAHLILYSSLILCFFNDLNDIMLTYVYEVAIPLLNEGVWKRNDRWLILRRLSKLVGYSTVMQH